MGLFVTKELYPGADTNTKRALGQADLTSLAIQKLLKAARAAKLKVNSPGWQESAWAHVTIPAKKVAIAIMGSNLAVKSKGIRDSWEKYGWRCFIIPKYVVDKSTVEDLAKDLVAALGEVGR